MPRLRIDQPDEIFETYESNRKRKSRKKNASKDRNSISSNSLLSVSNKKLLIVRRLIGDHDKPGLRREQKDAFEKFPENIQGKLEPVNINNFGTTLLSALVAEIVYDVCYDPGNKNSARRYNSKVKEFILHSNRANPFIYAQIGAVSIFGSKEVNSGAKFVAAELQSEDNLLEDEYAKLIKKLVPNNHKALIEEAIPNFAPHLSLFKTDSLITADYAIEQMNEAGQLRGKWVQLQPAVDRSIGINDIG